MEKQLTCSGGGMNDPGEMTEEERFQELASLLGATLRRLFRNPINLTPEEEPPHDEKVNHEPEG